jgi:hypothetical protein
MAIFVDSAGRGNHEGDDPSNDPAYQACLRGLRYRSPIYIVDPFFESLDVAENLCLRVSFGYDDDVRAHKEKYVSFAKYGFADMYETKEQQAKGCLANFVTLILDAEGATVSPGAAGSSAAPKKSLTTAYSVDLNSGGLNALQLPSAPPPAPNN